MSEHMFGVSRVKPTTKQAKRMEAIAKRHGVSFIAVVLPGTGYQHWFAGPNRGCPFDRTMEHAVMSEVESGHE